MIEITTEKSSMVTSTGTRYETHGLNCPHCAKYLKFRTFIGNTCYHCGGIIPLIYQFAHRGEERLKYHANVQKRHL